MSQIYSLCEISENNGKNGKPVWIIVKGVVYDVTKFLKDVIKIFINELKTCISVISVCKNLYLQHPGGDDLILEYAGKDATRAFNDVGHSIDAIQDMKTYKIGVVDNQVSYCETKVKSS